ncbi:hypothetical protein KPL47_08950 [Clostridium estertheticum]|uniref:hypothetical protein n=1 Tax=Clostridium estertheticum TaxID=238834 RepID=UPI001C0A9AFB|nr:hypothetical protein [Clostridium estertheticum]MBU3176500.1 hypothetical protein [Clostridium estertheticum]
MPYRTALTELQQQLLNNENNLWLFLQTNNNTYSFRSELTLQQQLDIIHPIYDYLNDKDYNQYDVLERLPNTIYYISKTMQEYQSLNSILELNHYIECSEVKRVTITTIETDKIKMIIFKKDRFLFLYTYNSGKIFKQGWKARFNNEDAVVEKENNGMLMLSKTIPDIILDTREKLAFILNVTQAEYILQIESLFIETLNTVSDNLREFKLMRIDTIDRFIDEVSGKNNYMRKLHKIQTTKSYQYFRDNITKIPEVLAQYDLNVNFDEQNGQIIFDEETNIAMYYIYLQMIMLDDILVIDRMS